jgi:hypothetical protein
MRRSVLTGLAGEPWSILQGSGDLMIRKGINEVIQVRLMIELNMELRNDTMQQNIDPETIGEILDARGLFPNILRGLDNGTHLFVIQISTILFRASAALHREAIRVQSQRLG